MLIKIHISFLSLFLLACSNICKIKPLGELTIAPPNADEAIQLVADFYYRKTGIKKVFKVYWSSTKIPARGKKYTGGTDSCLNIWVFTGADWKMYQTALAHEIAHCWAGDVPDVCGNDIDNTHNNLFWWGTYEKHRVHGLVSQANDLLAKHSL